MTQDSEMQRARSVKARHEGDLLKKANVVAVGVGFTEGPGQVSRRVGIIVSVRRKVPREQLAPGDVIPAELEGVPVEVRETGEIRAL